MTTKQAAAALGIQPRTVAKYIKRGLLKAQLLGRDYVIEQVEIERFQRERRGMGRPKQVKE